MQRIVVKGSVQTHSKPFFAIQICGTSAGLMQRSLANLNTSLASSSGRCDAQILCLRQGRCPGSRHLRAPSQGRQALKVQASSQNPGLKAQQAWTSFKHNAEDKAHRLKQQFLALPPIATLVQFIQAVRARLQPVIDCLTAWKEAWDDWWGLRDERYREFIGEETKRKWEWQCRHEAEEAFWTAVVNGAVGIFATVLYEAITPVSVLIAVLPPLWAAWALHDNILKAPIFWALIFMLPLKFPPFFPFKWII